MGNRIRNRRDRWGWLGLVAVLLLSGCQTPRFTEVGTEVEPTQRIVLVREESVPGRWDTPELILNYRFSAKDTTLDLQGAVQFTEMITMNFQTLQRFHLRLYWLDPNGRVLATRGLYSVGRGSSNDPILFRSQVDIPAGAALFALGYSGDVASQGQNASSRSLWHVPTTAMGGAQW